MLNKKSKITLQQIKQEIENLKGKPISFSVNQGRKRFVDFEGIIEQTYRSIFIVKLIKDEKNDALNELKEVLQGDIELTCQRREQEKPQNEAIEINHPQPDSTKTYTYIDILCGNFKLND